MKPLKDQKTAFPLPSPSPDDVARRERALRDGRPIVICHTGKDAPGGGLQAEWGTWILWCEACGSQHIHGAGEGLRSSHCATPGSTLFGGDYYLVHHTQMERVN